MTDKEISTMTKNCLNKAWVGCEAQYNLTLCGKFREIAICELSLLQEGYNELSVKNEVLERDRDNLQRTLEEANEELQELNEQLALAKHLLKNRLIRGMSRWIIREEQNHNRKTSDSSVYYSVGWGDIMGGYWAVYKFNTLDEAEQKVHYLNGGHSGESR